MKRFFAFILSLMLLITICGCDRTPTGSNPDADQNANIPTEDILLYQAVHMAKQAGLASQENYLKGLDLPAEAISAGQLFTESASTDPVQAKILTGQTSDLLQKAYEILASACGASQLAFCSSLNMFQPLQLPRTMEGTTAIYLRYSESCHYLVTFTPFENNRVIATLLPLPYSAAEQLLLQYFTDASDMNSQQIQASVKAGAKASVKARNTGKATTADYYIQLVTDALTKQPAVSSQQVAEYVDDEEIIQLTVNMSKAMQAGPGSASVYTFPQVLNDQVEQILENVTDPDALRQYTRQTIYLTYPNYHSNTFGTANIAANSILAKLLKTNSLGPTAKANEQPVLVLVELADGFTLLVSVFPGENHIYAYSFVCVPQAYDLLVARIEASGGNIVE